jgi:hypothetical protein
MLITPFAVLCQGETRPLSHISGDAVELVPLLLHAFAVRVRREEMDAPGRMIPPVQLPRLGQAERGNVADGSFEDVSLQVLAAALQVIPVEAVSLSRVVPSVKNWSSPVLPD